MSYFIGYLSPVDALFFVNHAYGDYTNLYELAGDLYRTGLVKIIAVTNNEGERFGSTEKFVANPGKTDCIRILTEEQKIPPENILVPQTAAFHTRQESDAFVELAKQEDWASAITLSQANRLLRVTLSMTPAMEQAGYMMELYTTAPTSTPWRELAFGSQSTKRQARFETIGEELERIFRYQKSGELPGIDDLLDYLDARDSGCLILSARGSNRFKT